MYGLLNFFVSVSSEYNSFWPHCMVVGFTSTNVIRAYTQYMPIWRSLSGSIIIKVDGFTSCPWQDILNIPLCEKFVITYRRSMNFTSLRYYPFLRKKIYSWHKVSEFTRYSCKTPKYLPVLLILKILLKVIIILIVISLE